MKSDYELGPDTSYGREVHYQGCNVGTIHKVLGSDSPDTIEHLALVRILTTTGKLVAKNLGQYSSVEEAFEQIVQAHSR
jgi:hypothetical protein